MPLDPLMQQEGRMTSVPPMQSEGMLPMPLENPLNRTVHGAMGIPPRTPMVTSMAADALLNGEDFDPTAMTPDKQLEAMLKSQKKERRKQMQMASGVRPVQPR